MKTVQNSKGYEISLVDFFLVFLGIFALWGLVHVLLKASSSGQLVLLFMLIPVAFGIVYENMRLSIHWKHLLIKIFGSLILSLFVFHHPRDDTSFFFEDHIESWVYAFIFIFVIVSMLYHQDKTIPELSEGTTLLYSVGFLYWISEQEISNATPNLIFLSIIGVFSLFSIIHSLSYIAITNSARLVLSIWSSLILIVFSFSNIVAVVSSQGFRDVGAYAVFMNTLEYFMLGVSLIYILKNASMLLVYFPSRDRDYKKNVRKMNIKHIKRFSKVQVNIKDAIFAIVFSVGVYFVNYKFKMIPKNTMIWTVFVVFPVLLRQLKNYKSIRN